MSSNYNQIAEQDFYKARTRSLLTRMYSIINRNDTRLLPFEEAKNLIRPESETYSGLVTVPLEKIIGSEGRYRDFDRHFLPQKDMLKARWINIDKTHYEDIPLPPVRLYEMGGVYFVRDGNHRVSVARTRGQEYIDAEVTSLKSRIPLSEDMSIDTLKQKVIEFEKNQFYEKTNYLAIVRRDDLNFSEPGRYDTIYEHIIVHKYFLNQSSPQEIPFADALYSWHENVYMPIIHAIYEEPLLNLFPGRTDADLYLFLVRHWDELKHASARDVGVGEAARHFRQTLKAAKAETGSLKGPVIFRALAEFFRKLQKK